MILKNICIYTEDGGDRDAFYDEEDVIPPSMTHRATSRISSSFGKAYRDIDDEEEEGMGTDEDYDDERLQYGSNGGIIQLPYIYVKVTHAPEGDETGRMKKLHLILHLISGTHAKMGYSVSCPPKGHKIIITHQKGLENIFWGHTGRAMVPAGVAQDQLTLACAAMTTNFTIIPQQQQVIEFPFPLERILKKKPFFVNTGNGPGQQFLGLYICAKVDWVDVEADGAGDEYIELHSPNPKNTANGNPFYAGSVQSTDVGGDEESIVGRKSKVGRNTCGGGGKDAADEEFLEKLDKSDLRILKRMLANAKIKGELNISMHEDVEGVIKDTCLSNNLKSSSVKRTPIFTSSAAGVRGISSGFTGGLGSVFKKLSPYEITATTAAAATVDDVSGVSYDDEVDDVEEVYHDEFGVHSRH